MKILILCTGNSCRSQMAQAFLQSFDPRLEVYSAGTDIAKEVNLLAIKAMADIGIDIGLHYPKNVVKYIQDEWDYVITVCDNANENCPVFIGNVKHRLHMGFEDPSKAIGSPEFIWSEFLRIRNEIKECLFDFYKNNLLPLLDPVKKQQEPLP